MRRRCDSDKRALSMDKLQSILPSIFLSFIVAAQRGNDIFPFYRHRSAREQYFAILSSPCSVPANASATPLRQIIRASGRQTRRKC